VVVIVVGVGCRVVVGLVAIVVLIVVLGAPDASDIAGELVANQASIFAAYSVVRELLVSGAVTVVSSPNVIDTVHLTAPVFQFAFIQIETRFPIFRENVAIITVTLRGPLVNDARMMATKTFTRVYNHVVNFAGVRKGDVLVAQVSGAATELVVVEPGLYVTVFPAPARFRDRGTVLFHQLVLLYRGVVMVVCHTEAIFSRGAVLVAIVTLVRVFSTCVLFTC
jgi:hypothetical protein